MIDHRTPAITRRQALAAALGTAGLAAIGGGDALGSLLAEKASMRIGCGTVTFRKRPLKEAFERIQRAGYEYVEPQATGPWCPHVDAWKDDPQEFRRLVKEYGFKGVSALWAPHGAIVADPKCVEGITQAIRWAKEAGIPVVNAGDGHKPPAMSHADALKLVGERLGKILEVAEKCQVYLAIEPHGSFSVTADGLAKLMALSPSKWLGINYDTANVHHAYAAKTTGPRAPYGRLQDEVTVLKAVVGRVVHVHVKDTSGGKCVPLGQGDVNLKGCLEVLREHGYQGALSLETEGEFDAEQGQRLIEASRAHLLKTLAP